MKQAFSGTRQQFLERIAIRSMIGMLLLLAPPALCGPLHSLPHPSLGDKRLLRAYKSHRSGAKRFVGAIQWSPNGSHGFYTVDEEPDPTNGCAWSTLFSVRRNGSRIRKLYSWQEPGSYVPDVLQWSPDSSHILLRLQNFSPASSVNADGVQLIDFDPETREKRQLSRGLNGRLSTGFILNTPGYFAFSPNGKYLLLTLGCNRQNLTNKRLVRIDYATGKRKLLTPFRMATFNAHWSPDGNQILYTALPDSGEAVGTPTQDCQTEVERRIKHQHLYVMNADGSHKRLLLAQAGYFEEEPAWIANGRKISFVRRQMKNKNSRTRWAICLDGSGLTHMP